MIKVISREIQRVKPDPEKEQYDWFEEQMNEYFPGAEITYRFNPPLNEEKNNG